MGVDEDAVVFRKSLMDMCEEAKRLLKDYGGNYRATIVLRDATKAAAHIIVGQDLQKNRVELILALLKNVTPQEKADIIQRIVS